MKEKIIIVGAGGFGKEVLFLLDRLKQFEVVGFVDDDPKKQNEMILGFPVLGSLKELLSYRCKINVVIAIADPFQKLDAAAFLGENKELHFPNVIDPACLQGLSIKLGKGNILMANTILTAEIQIGDFNMVNLGCTIGHDLRMGSYNTVFPACNISGATQIGNQNIFGVGTKVLPNVKIENRVIIGAGAVVRRDLASGKKVAGVPAKEIYGGER